jgi:Ribosomal protein L7/L12 C-terminal domain
VAELTDQHRDAIIASLYAGQKIQAIKQYRLATGQGLKESKDFIEALEARLREETPDRFQSGPPAGCGAGVLVIVMLSAILAGAAGFVLLWR